MDLVLAQIDQLLDNEALYQLIRNDLANYRVSHQKLVYTRHDSENPVGMSASNSGHPDRVLTKYLLDQLNNKS